MQTSKALGYLSAFSLIFFAAGCASAKPEPLPSVETPPPIVDDGTIDGAETADPDDAAMKDDASTDGDLNLDMELDALDKEINSVDVNDYNPQDLPTDYSKL